MAISFRDANNLANVANDLMSPESRSFMPDFSRFSNVIASRELARTNLFLVRFRDFRSVLNDKGERLIVPDTGIETGNALRGGGGLTNAWNRSRDTLTNITANVAPSALLAVGATDIGMLRTFGMGDTLDTLFDSGYDINKDFGLMVKSVNLPNVSFDVNTIKHAKKPYGKPTNRTTGNVSVTFYCTRHYEERIFMLQWMNYIHNNKKNSYSFYNQYSSMIEIATLSAKGLDTSLTICDGCFPMNVGEVQLSYENGNEVASFTVEFNVSDFKQIKKDLPSPSIFETTMGAFNQARQIDRTFRG
ncbi:hypothetical protein VmeM32_00111 [Vibrio phage vB_VmeM-32]|nr:hypothetical protein VmeM32_00111 [Vibrio phage vB_VmeM-32]